MDTIITNNTILELKGEIITPKVHFYIGDRKTVEEWKMLLGLEELPITPEWFKIIEKPMFTEEDLVGAVYDILNRIKELSRISVPGSGPMSLSHDPSGFNPMLSFLESGEEKNRAIIKMLVQNYLKK